MPEKFKFYNPAYGGSGEQRAEYEIPSEGETFLLSGGTTPILGIRKGNKIYSTYHTGTQASQLSQKIASDLGINLSNLKDYNFNQGIQLALGLPQSSWGETFSSAEQFKQLQQQGNVSGYVYPNMEAEAKASQPAYEAGLAYAQSQPDAYQEWLKQSKVGNQVSAAAGGQVSPDTAKYFGMTGAEFAKSKESGWIDTTTGQQTPVGVGIPKSTIQGVHIKDEAELQQKREQLAGAGIPQSDWSKYISAPDAQGKLYWQQPATLISSTGEKKVVASGSTEASNLLKSGWNLMGSQTDSGDFITPDALKGGTEIDLGEGTKITGDSSLADRTVASIKVDVQSTQDQIQQNLKLLQAPESDLSKRVEALLGEAETAAGDLTGRGAMQLEEEEKRKIEEQQTLISDKTTELNKKLAEVDALTASYNLENQREEGRPQTLSRLQGAQAQNYKMYLTQKNLIVSEASYMQAELLGLQGKLQSAQAAANRAVDLEFSDRESYYNSKINLLNILIPQLEKEEKQYAQAVALTLQQQADALSEEKAAKSQIQNVKLQAISSGITDASILNQIGNAKSYNEALQILGTSLPKKVKTEVIGSATTGYKLVSYDNQGNIIKSQSITGGTGGGGETISTTATGKVDIFKLTNTQKNQLGLLGMSGELVNDFINSINQNGIDQTLNALETEDGQPLDKNSKSMIRQIIETSETTKIGSEQQRKKSEFLSKDYFIEDLGYNKLEKLAKKAGFTKGGFLGIGVGRGEGEGVDMYLDEIMRRITTGREQGYTDEELWESLKGILGV